MTDTKSNIAVEPHCVHVIGIGRTGAVYVEALLRTGEVEDNLVNEGTTFSTLLVDVGDGDIQVANDYARSFKTRMASRGIPADRFNHESVVLAPGDASKRLDDVRVSLERFAKGLSRRSISLPFSSRAALPERRAARWWSMSLANSRSSTSEAMS